MHGNIYRQVTRHSTPMQCGTLGTDSAYLCPIESWDVRHSPTDIELSFLDDLRWNAMELTWLCSKGQLCYRPSPDSSKYFRPGK